MKLSMRSSQDVTTRRKLSMRSLKSADVTTGEEAVDESLKLGADVSTRGGELWMRF